MKQFNQQWNVPASVKSTVNYQWHWNWIKGDPDELPQELVRHRSALVPALRRLQCIRPRRRCKSSTQHIQLQRPPPFHWPVPNQLKTSRFDTVPFEFHSSMAIEPIIKFFLNDSHGCSRILGRDLSHILNDSYRIFVSHIQRIWAHFQCQSYWICGDCPDYHEIITGFVSIVGMLAQLFKILTIVLRTLWGSLKDSLHIQNGSCRSVRSCDPWAIVDDYQTDARSGVTGRDHKHTKEKIKKK